MHGAYMQGQREREAWMMRRVEMVAQEVLA